jgi:uncharacterized protein YbjT (DUF2867 family)
MKSELTLIVGASGTVGSEIVKLLKAQGRRVRTTTSRAVSSADGEKVQINLATGAGIKEAFEGVDQAFLLSPPGFADQHAILQPLIQEAKRRGLKKVILMTALGANAVETSPFRRAELELEKSGLTYNIVRPNWFYQNFNTFWSQGIKVEGKIQLPAGDAKTGFIDARDVSAFVAKLLTTHDFDNQAFDITGPQSVTHGEVAEALSKALKKPVTYQDLDPQVLKKGLVSAGLPEDYVNFMILIFGFLREGYNSTVNANFKKVVGRDPIGLKKYVSDHLQAWN